MNGSGIDPKYAACFFSPSPVDLFASVCDRADGLVMWATEVARQVNGSA
jgi:hypothetical protein